MNIMIFYQEFRTSVNLKRNLDVETSRTTCTESNSLDRLWANTIFILRNEALLFVNETVSERGSWGGCRVYIMTRTITPPT